MNRDLDDAIASIEANVLIRIRISRKHRDDILPGYFFRPRQPAPRTTTRWYAAINRPKRRTRIRATPARAVVGSGTTCARIDGSRGEHRGPWWTPRNHRLERRAVAPIFRRGGVTGNGRHNLAGAG